MSTLEEVILSTTSSAPSSSKPTAPSRASFAPPSTSTTTLSTSSGSGALTLHSLSTSSLLHSFKGTSSPSHSVGVIPSANGLGGALFAAQEGKSVCNVYAWGKDQMWMRMHLPERMSCWAVSPDGVWAAGGTATGHVYLWEIASGLLLASFDAHYRRISVLRFTPDSHALLSASDDAGLSVWDVQRLVDDALADEIPRPYATLGDHTLAITDVVVGKGCFPECRVFSASVDGTVKQWDLNPPTLLTTFTLPPSSTSLPSCLSLDPLERFFHVGTTAGEIHRVALVRRRREMGRDEEDGSGERTRGEREVVEALGGMGVGGESVKVGDEKGKGRINLGSGITALSLSISQTHLLSGTASGEIHVHALPSHQHLRTILTHVGSPISHLSTMLRPPDLVGHVSLAAAMHGGLAGGAGGREGWPTMEVRTFERMRVGGKMRKEQEVGVMLGGLGADEWDEVDSAMEIISSELPERSGGEAVQSATVAAGDASAEKAIELEAEVMRLRSQLTRAKHINDKIWASLVDLTVEGARRAELEKSGRLSNGNTAAEDIDM